MKTRICLLLAIAVLSAGCAKRKFQKEIVGTWVPYEIVSSDGTVDTGPFNLRSIFGIYAESIQFKSDGTYVPMQQLGPGEPSPKAEEAGKYVYNPKYAELSLTEGVIDMKFTVEKLEKDKLWLYSSVTMWHFRLERH
jgi:hypothetical protein